MGKIILTSYFLLAFFFNGCGDSKVASDRNQASASLDVTAESATSGSDISEEELEKTLSYLSSDELLGRETGTEGIEKAANYIENIFQKNDIEPFFETYRDSFEVEGKTGFNIVGLKEGSDPQLKDEFIIIGAHYDHIGIEEPVGNDSIANGANDNASGTAAVLQLAKVLEGIDTKRSILYTLYSAEEMGLVGSAYLAERLKEQNLDLYVMFNIEMIGIPMAGKDFTAYLTGFNKSNLAQQFNEYADAKVLGYLPQAKDFNLFMRSDNYPFYKEFGVPAQTISTFDFTNYDFYHHVNDEFQYMDVSHMADLLEKIVPGISKMANTPTKEIKMSDS